MAPGRARGHGAAGRLPHPAAADPRGAALKFLYTVYIYGYVYDCLLHFPVCDPALLTDCCGGVWHPAQPAGPDATGLPRHHPASLLAVLRAECTHHTTAA